MQTVTTAADSQASAAPEAARPEGVKETAESILVAFILAFVFRAFVIEAFVIPTGSMAATLYGKHGTLTCEDCGWENSYGLTDLTTREPQFGPHDAVRCQNCAHRNTNLRVHDGVVRRGSRFSREASNAEPGDRILVFKWPLDLGIDSLKPRRWDVTVFKNPAQVDENFIKRLVGLPSEVLEIIDGDVYSVPVGDLSQATVQALQEILELKVRCQAGAELSPRDARRLEQPPPVPVLDELAGKLRICPKTEIAQESLWIPVYDHDYPPTVLDDGQPFWRVETSESGTWSTAQRKLTFRGSAGGQARVRFDGKPIEDFNSYNINFNPRSANPVSDLRLQGVLSYLGGEGFLEFTLFKRDDEFTLRLQTDGRVALTRTTRGKPPIVVAEERILPLPQRPLEFAFQNVDYRVSFDLDGREVLATTPGVYAPRIPTLRDQPPGPTSSPSITGSGLDVELWHVALFRDEFYTSPTLESSATVKSWAHRGWGTTKNPILLRAHEYFMLGDNSSASQDSRLWDQIGPQFTGRGSEFQLGTAPADQIIGRAFFVYWPSGLRPEWLPLVGEYGIIPNAGRLRWIR